MSARVLVVDDAAVERALVRGLLKQEGFDVVGEASSGVQAVDRFRALQPDVAIIDLMLPQMSGVEVARAILALQPRAVLVAMSSLSQPSVQAEVVKAGMRGFVIKPIERRALVAQIRGALAAR